MATCVQCKEDFPEGDLISFDGAEVCAECKTEYLQMIKEGVDTITNDNLPKRSFFTRPTCPDCGNIISRIEFMKVCIRYCFGRLFGPCDFSRYYMYWFRRRYWFL